MVALRTSFCTVILTLAFREHLVRALQLAVLSVANGWLRMPAFIAASVFLCVSSVPRALAKRKPVPAILAVAGAAAATYYGKVASDLGLWPFA